MDLTDDMRKAAWKAQYIFNGGNDETAETLAAQRVNDPKQKEQDKFAFDAMMAVAPQSPATAQGEPMIITNHFSQKPMKLTHVLFALAGQENNDGDEGNAMQAAGDYIRQLQPQPASDQRQTVVADGMPERLAQSFHETYERLAPSHGYETRKESAKPWSDVPDNNRNLMIAVCAEITRDFQPLIDALEKLSRLGNEPHFGNSHGNIIAQQALALLQPYLPAREVR